MYSSCVAAIKNKNVIRFDLCEELTGDAVADASGRTTERSVRSCALIKAINIQHLLRKG